MNKSILTRVLSLFSIISLCFIFQARSQMKIGHHPTQIHPFSILELESSQQALRLTQGDTAEVNNVLSNVMNITNIHDTSLSKVKAAEGLIMFQTNGNPSDIGLYMRMGGYWHKIVSDEDVAGGNNFNNEAFTIGGNEGTEDTTFLGLTNNKNLAVGVNKNPNLIITSDGAIHLLDSLVGILLQVDSIYAHTGSIKTLAIDDSLTVGNGSFTIKEDSTTVTNRFVMKDSIFMTQLNKATTDSMLLTITKEGQLHYLNIDSIFSADSLIAFNGERVYLNIDTLSNGHHRPWVDSSRYNNDNVLTLNIPMADLNIKAGLVSDSTQAFSGAKSFTDSIAIGTTERPKANLDVHGSVNMKTVRTETNYNLGNLGNDSLRTLIVDVENATGKITIRLPKVTNIKGRIYTIKKVGKADENQLDSPVEITANGSDTFADGATATTLYNNWTSLTIQALNGKWYVVGH